MQVEFGGTKVEVQAFGSSLRLDWESGLREVESTR